MVADQHFSRVDTIELKALIYQKIGHKEWINTWIFSKIQKAILCYLEEVISYSICALLFISRTLRNNVWKYNLQNHNTLHGPLEIVVSCICRANIMN